MEDYVSCVGFSSISFEVATWSTCQNVMHAFPFVCLSLAAADGGGGRHFVNHGHVVKIRLGSVLWITEKRGKIKLGEFSSPKAAR